MSRFIKNFCALGLCVSASLFASSYALNSAPSDDVSVDNTEVASSGTALGSVSRPFAATGVMTMYVNPSNNILYATGENNNGELGIGNTGENRTSFFAMRKRGSTTTSATGTAKANETGYFYNVIDFCGAPEGTFVIDSDGAVWGSGYNNYGQLGFGNTTSRYYYHYCSNILSGASRVEAGNVHTLVLMDDGTLWGAGYTYRIGLGTSGSQTTFVEVIDEHTVTERRGIVDFSCGLSSSYVLFGDGTFWYSNDASQGVWTQMATNIKMFDIDNNGSYIYAVNQSNHVLYASTSATSFTTLTESPAGTDGSVEITQIRGSGGNYGWGYLTSDGDLYLSSTSTSNSLYYYAAIPTTATVSGVSYFDLGGQGSIGLHFAYLETSTGSMRLWGTNGGGELGTGNYTALSFANRKTIALGASFDANAGIYNTPPLQQ